MENKCDTLWPWVGRFLNFADQPGDKPFEQLLQSFSDSLADRIDLDTWQLRQAVDAITMFQYQFRPYRNRKRQGKEPQDLPPRIVSHKEAVKQLHQIMRLRHYSPATEKSYVSWLNRFYNYCNNAGIDQPFGEEDIKSFLTHLAMDLNVSAATQNQAFSALLLVCREILFLNLTERKQNVRAKQNRRLPVVLTKP